MALSGGVAVSVAGVASGGFNIRVCLRVWGRMGCSGHAVIACHWWSPGVAPHPPVSAEHVVGLGVPQEGVCVPLCGRPGACLLSLSLEEAAGGEASPLS